MNTLYFGSLLTASRDRAKELVHHDEPLVLDKGIQETTVFTFIDIVPQSTTHSNFSFLSSSRNEVNYHKFSDLIKKANQWFNENPDWQIVNCETVLIFFTCENGLWNLASDGSCFTLDNGQQSALFALRLWIRRSLAKQNSPDDETPKSNHQHSHLTHSTHSTYSSMHQSSYANHIHQANHVHYASHTTHHSNHPTNRNRPQSPHSQGHHSPSYHPQGHHPQGYHPRRSRPVPATSPSAIPGPTLADPNNNVDRSATFTLKYRDFVPDNPEPGNHYKFEKLDHVIEKLNLAILNQELNAEDCITIETLYFPVDCDFIVDSRLELTLHSFPSSYVCILRVFYIERKDRSSSLTSDGSAKDDGSTRGDGSTKGDRSTRDDSSPRIENGEELANEAPKSGEESRDESMTSKLRKLGYAFKIQIKDFIPKTLNRGTFFKKPEFEQLSTCIERASKFIEDESKLHQLKHQSLMRELKMENHDFLFDFKNAQCIEIKTKILKHNIDSKVMAHTTDNGDYIRIFRVAYMQVIRLDDRSTTFAAGKNAVVSKIPSLLSKSKQLIRAKQFSKSFSLSNTDSQDESLLNGGDGEEERSKTIHLTSIIFTPTDSVTTISEMKRKIQNYTMTRCRDDQSDETDELARYSRKPRLLSAETVEIYTKNFSSEEIEKETENCFQFNRLGTMNNFLYFSFRIYLDDVESRRPDLRNDLSGGLANRANSNRNDRLIGLRRSSRPRNQSGKNKSTCTIL